ASVDLDEQVVHHARGVLTRAVGGDARAVRHHAGGDARGFHHHLGVDNGDATGHRIAVEIEVDDVDEATVWRNVHGGWEHAELDLASGGIGVGVVLHRGAEGPAVADGDEEAFAIGRKGYAVRAADIAFEQARFGLLDDFGFGAVEAHRDDAIGGFADELEEVVGAVGAES